VTTTEGTHERLVRADVEPAGSDRAFGIVFAVACAVLAAWPLASGQPVRLWAAVASLAFLATALTMPALLGPLNRLWVKLGVLMSRIVSPVVLGLMFYGVFVPMGLVFRVLGKDPLRRTLDPAAPSYWIDRRPPGPSPATITNQF
jgi:hypothetical protein